ncbi:SH3 and PX domain-containing protein 2A-like [Actinia tenebrosa]|uniref:SH3 and PX domain-containing protein 2A-like n=1 Tax=Actinia tenebrosa TaxID=6105 RepID=A0A6P8HBH4_ACTTE|nr:SH3 and PX domain-containing protein 2A-like [Actinia tenebrosa]XP_031552479.1 SH3 and PX domain-containing protein 2A-like [Actinia tenebrosa]
MSLSAVSDITVERVVKQKSRKKHFVFSIQVEWKDGLIIRIYRSYDDALNLQDKLRKMDEFNSYLNNEAAEYRNGYSLQDKGLFGKVTIKTSKQARRRMVEVEEFLKSIVHLPSHISMADVVVTFFRPVPDDLMFVDPERYEESLKEAKGTRQKNDPLHISEPILLDQYVAISDYTRMNKNDLNLKAGDIVEVIYKADHGWWFVDLDGELGWVPASYLESRDGDMDEQIMETFEDGQEEMYIAMGKYDAEYDDEIQLEIGKLVQVKQKKMDGWWLVKCNDRIGWVPCMHLHELSTSSTKSNAREMGREKALMTMNNIFAITDRRRTWNPSLPPKRLSTFKSTVRRRRFEKEETIQEEDEDEEKPSYMNIEFHKKIVKTTTKIPSNDNDEEAGPSYINLDFHKKDNTKANKKKKNVVLKDEEKEKGPSYINMEFHRKKDQAMAPRQRVRRRRDEDEDLVEIDFDKMKKFNSQSKETSSKAGLVENEIPKDNGSGNEEGNSMKDEMKKVEMKKVEMKVENSLADSDSNEYEFPPSFSEKPLNTEGLGQVPENVTLQAKSQKKLKFDLKIHIPEPTDETDMTSGSNIYLAVGDYTKESDREVNLQTGTSVEVLEQSEGGWWLVRTKSLTIGWAPSNFLEKISKEELERRKELGLESPTRSPLRPPKSPRVHRMAKHVSTEQKFWNFMRKSDQNNATCSIVDEKEVCRVDDSRAQQLTVMDVNGNRLGEYHVHEPSKHMKKSYICDSNTGVCKLEQNEDRL